MTHFHDSCHGKCLLRHVEGVLELQKFDFWSPSNQFDIKKANFVGLLAKIASLRHILASRAHLWPVFCVFFCREKSSLKFIGVIDGQWKLDFWGLKSHFDAKKAYFMGLLAKIGYLRSVLASRTQKWPIFMIYAMGIVY